MTHRPHTCGAHLEFMRGWLVYLSISIYPYLSIQSRGCSLDNHKYIRSGSIPSGVTRGRVLYNIGRPIIAQTHLTSGAMNVKNKYFSPNFNLQYLDMYLDILNHFIDIYSVFSTSQHSTIKVAIDIYVMSNAGSNANDRIIL